MDYQKKKATSRKEAVSRRIAKSGTNAGNPIKHPKRDYASEIKANSTEAKEEDRRVLGRKRYAAKKAGRSLANKDVINHRKPGVQLGDSSKNRSKGAKKQRAKENGR